MQQDGRLIDEDEMEDEATAQATSSLHEAGSEAPARRRKDANACQVAGCTADLSKMKRYHQRYKICEHHLRNDVTTKDGDAIRFCQQCGRFHGLDVYDGPKRSCRERLARHNARRTKRNDQSAISCDSGANQNSDGRPDPSIHVHQLAKTEHPHVGATEASLQHDGLMAGGLWRGGGGPQASVEHQHRRRRAGTSIDSESTPSWVADGGVLRSPLLSLGFHIADAGGGGGGSGRPRSATGPLSGLGFHNADAGGGGGRPGSATRPLFGSTQYDSGGGTGGGTGVLCSVEECWNVALAQSTPHCSMVKEELGPCSALGTAGNGTVQQQQQATMSSPSGQTYVSSQGYRPSGRAGTTSGIAIRPISDPATYGSLAAAVAASAGHTSTQFEGAQAPSAGQVRHSSHCFQEPSALCAALANMGTLAAAEQHSSVDMSWPATLRGGRGSEGSRQAMSGHTIALMALSGSQGNQGSRGRTYDPSIRVLGGDMSVEAILDSLTMDAPAVDPPRPTSVTSVPMGWFINQAPVDHFAPTPLGGMKPAARPSVNVNAQGSPATGVYGLGRPTADLYGQGRPTADPFAQSSDLYGQGRPMTDPYGQGRPASDIFGQDRPASDPYASGPQRPPGGTIDQEGTPSDSKWWARQ